MTGPSLGSLGRAGKGKVMDRGKQGLGKERGRRSRRRQYKLSRGEPG